MKQERLGYILLAIAAGLIIIAWLNSSPLSLRTPDSYLYNSIYPTFWIGLSLASISLFLIARYTRSSWEQLACGVVFVLLMYSVHFFFTFTAGPDANTFRGLTENYISTGTLLPQEHDYYQWPSLFVLGAVVAELMRVSANTASGILFAAWSLVLAGGLFLYTTRRNNIEDFLSIAVYIIALYPFLNWQYSAQTFALALFTICTILITRNDRGSRVLTILIFITLVSSHAFFAIFLLVAMFILALSSRGYIRMTIILSAYYVSYVIFQSALFFRGAVGAIGGALLEEYSSVLATTLAPPASSLDTFTQLISRTVTISVWILLGTITLHLLLHRKLRKLDISLGGSGLVGTIIGTALPVLGSRALQVAAFPAAYVIRAFTPSSRLQKALLTYFVLILVLFPLGFVHYYYDDTNYLTMREQHAINTVLVAGSEHGSLSDARVLTRNIVATYANAKTINYTNYITQHDPELLASASWFNYVFVSPELWHDLNKYAGQTPAQLNNLEGGTIYFSRVYSNGYVVVLFNPNATALPKIGS
jgi:hypothetical protein